MFCPYCGKEKQDSQFYKSPIKTGEYIKPCKSCVTELYKQALESINQDLEANKIMTASAEDDLEKQFCKDQYNQLMEQKAIVLLLLGEHRQAKTILKELDTPYAKKALEELLW